MDTQKRLAELLKIMEKNKDNPLGSTYQNAAREYYTLRDKERAKKTTPRK